MRTIFNATEVGKVFEKQKDYFQIQINGLYDLLWKVIVYDTTEKEIIVFHPVYGLNGLEIGLVTLNELGWSKTGVLFKSDVTYETACTITDEMNQDVFGVMPMLAARVVNISMGIPEAKPDLTRRAEKSDRMNPILTDRLFVQEIINNLRRVNGFNGSKAEQMLRDWSGELRNKAKCAGKTKKLFFKIVGKELWYS